MAIKFACDANIARSIRNNFVVKRKFRMPDESTPQSDYIGIKTKMLEVLPVDGSKIGNKAARSMIRNTITTLTDADYWAAREELIKDNKVALARGGNGGSIYKLVEAPTVAPIAPAIAVTEVAASQTERELYDPFIKVIETSWVKDYNIKDYVIEKTAQQGRRDTGGDWTRPDVSLVHIIKYPFIPSIKLHVTTFELKNNDLGIKGVYECLAHTVFANNCILAIKITEELKQSPEYERLVQEAKRMGIGLLIFYNVENYDTYDLVVESHDSAANDEDRNEFILGQISPEKQLKILEMIK